MKNKKLSWILIYAVVVTLVFKLAFFRLEEYWHWDLFFIISIILILWFGNVYIDQQLNKRIPWIKQPKRRLIFQIVCNTLFTTVTLFVLMYIVHQIKFGDGRIINRKMVETFLPALSITYVVLAIQVSWQFFSALKDSMLEVEKYKTESMLSQMQNLKNQLNPHFLFNNLSVLSSLVYKDQDKAVEFINELSKVYRYTLDTKTSELVTLEEELLFLHHYIYLLKIRFEHSISIQINIDDNLKNAMLPPMCLQMLVENTIQHNETSKASPLQVNIFTEHHSLNVENKVMPRSDKTISSNMGLKNIQSRYAYFTDEKVTISDDGQVFKVVLPLLKHFHQHKILQHM
ncbi:MAG: histidine kinase [Saprospiraceae bacterium]|nr:histidine kinase [Saprospiraceae bacterium]